MDFVMQNQLQNAWCWAAVTVSCSKYYNSDSQWSQCLLVNKALEQTTACIDGSTPECNQPWYLDKALQITENLQSFIQGSQDVDTVQTQMNENKPLGVRIGWKFGGGHFVVISNIDCSKSTPVLTIDDPYFGRSYVTFDTFVTNYKNSGKWSHTYFTKKEGE